MMLLRIDSGPVQHRAAAGDLLFKGTEKRPTAQEISELIDGVGGVMNAGTDRELTVYYAKVARPHFDRAADVLTDMVRNPLIAAEELEKERKVVIEELASIADSPPQLVDVLLDATMWPDQPLGRDVAGSEASVTALTRDATLDYMRRQYVPNNIVVAVAGAIEHDEVVAGIEQALGDWRRACHPAGSRPSMARRPPARPSCTRRRSRPTSRSPSTASRTRTRTASPST